jgi:hypothetical protein
MPMRLRRTGAALAAFTLTALTLTAVTLAGCGPAGDSGDARGAHGPGGGARRRAVPARCSGNHFCTASVVASPGRDLLVTAAHCINGGPRGGARSDVVFIPGYRDGKAPFGIWSPARLVVAKGWVSAADPDLDVGFVVLGPYHGRNI